MTGGLMLHRYKAGEDPNPYRRFIFERKEHLLVGVRIGRYVHILRIWGKR